MGIGDISRKLFLTIREENHDAGVSYVGAGPESGHHPALITYEDIRCEQFSPSPSNTFWVVGLAKAKVCILFSVTSIFLPYFYY
jgi:hypothetical protein